MQTPSRSSRIDRAGAGARRQPLDRKRIPELWQPEALDRRLRRRCGVPREGRRAARGSRGVREPVAGSRALQPRACLLPPGAWARRGPSPGAGPCNPREKPKSRREFECQEFACGSRTATWENSESPNVTVRRRSLRGRSSTRRITPSSPTRWRLSAPSPDCAAIGPGRERSTSGQSRATTVPANASAIAFPLQYLAGLLREDGEAREAVRLYERALAVQRKAFGDRHRDVAESWQELARGRLAVNDLSGAPRRQRTAVIRSAPRLSRTALSSPADSSFSAICFASRAVRAKPCRTSKKLTRSGPRILRRIPKSLAISRPRSPPPTLRNAERCLPYPSRCPISGTERLQELGARQRMEKPMCTRTRSSEHCGVCGGSLESQWCASDPDDTAANRVYAAFRCQSSWRRPVSVGHLHGRGRVEQYPRTSRELSAARLCSSSNGLRRLAMVNTLDGWALQPRISVAFTGDVDTATLNSNAVFLLDVSGGARIGIDQLIWDPASHTLYAQSDEVYRPTSPVREWSSPTAYATPRARR